MPARFLIEDTNNVMYALHISDDGEVAVWTPEGEDPDDEAIEALAALGLEPEVTGNIDRTWELVKESLHKEGELQDLLESVKMHGTRQRRSAYYYPYTSSEFDYEFTTPEFAAYLGTALAVQLKKGYGDASDIATLIAALRNEDGSALEFDIENGRWHESYSPSGWTDPQRAWSCIDRSVTADGEELFEYCTDYENEIWDPVFFQSEVDKNREPGMDEIATSSELPEVLETFGLTDKEEKLHQEAVKEAPAPEKPAEPDEDGEWGVYYLYEHTEHDPKTGQWVDEWREVVVPYYDLDDAQRAYELSKSLIEDWDRQEFYPKYFIVHRASPEYAAEQKLWRKQLPLFEEEMLEGETRTVFADPALDIWRSWDDEEDEEDEEDDDE